MFLDCTRAADQNYTGLVTVHLSTVKELQRQYDITTECEVRRLTSSPNQMVTQGAPWGRKGGSAFDLLSYASALSPSLSTDVHVCTGVRKGVANWTGQYLISTGGIFLAKADHVWFMNVQSFASSNCLPLFVVLRRLTTSNICLFIGSGEFSLALDLRRFVGSYHTATNLF